MRKESACQSRHICHIAAAPLSSIIFENHPFLHGEVMRISMWLDVVLIVETLGDVGVMRIAVSWYLLCPTCR